MIKSVSLNKDEAKKFILKAMGNSSILHFDKPSDVVEFIDDFVHYDKEQDELGEVPESEILREAALELMEEKKEEDRAAIAEAIKKYSRERGFAINQSDLKIVKLSPFHRSGRGGIIYLLSASFQKDEGCVRKIIQATCFDDDKQVEISFR